MIVHERRACAVLHHLATAAPEGRFLMPANVCNVVPLTYRRAGRAIELVDIEEDSLMIDGARCLESLGSDPGGVAGVVLVRTYGADADFSRLIADLRRVSPDILVIDDACLSRPPESFDEGLGGADARVWSTGYAKYVDLGTGGFAQLEEGTAYSRVVLPYDERDLERVDAGVKAAVAERRWFEDGAYDWLDTRPPEEPWQLHHERILAALPEVDLHKHELSSVYEALLPPGVSLPSAFNSWRHHLLVPEPDLLIAELFSAGVFASRHYPSLGGILGPGDFPVARRLHGHVVNLFNDRYFTVEQAELAAQAVGRHVARYGLADTGLLGSRSTERGTRA